MQHKNTDGSLDGSLEHLYDVIHSRRLNHSPEGFFAWLIGLHDKSTSALVLDLCACHFFHYHEKTPEITNIDNHLDVTLIQYVQYVGIPSSQY